MHFLNVNISNGLENFRNEAFFWERRCFWIQ